VNILIAAVLVVDIFLTKPVPEFCKDRTTYITACATGHGVNTHRDRSNDWHC